jgi:hypothetical protein
MKEKRKRNSRSEIMSSTTSSQTTGQVAEELSLEDLEAKIVEFEEGYARVVAQINQLKVQAFDFNNNLLFLQRQFRLKSKQLKSGGGSNSGKQEAIVD